MAALSGTPTGFPHVAGRPSVRGNDCRGCLPSWPLPEATYPAAVLAGRRSLLPPRGRGHGSGTLLPLLFDRSRQYNPTANRAGRRGLASSLLVCDDIPLRLSARGANHHGHPATLSAAPGHAPSSSPLIRGDIPLWPSARGAGRHGQSVAVLPLPAACPSRHILVAVLLPSAQDAGLVPTSVSCPCPRWHCLVREDILHGFPRELVRRGDVPLNRASTSRLSGTGKTSGSHATHAGLLPGRPEA